MSDEKKYLATDRKLKKSKSRGDLPKIRDITNIFNLLAVFLIFFVIKYIISQFNAQTLSHLFTGHKMDVCSMPEVVKQIVLSTGVIYLSTTLLFVVFSFVAEYLQVGIGFFPNKLKFDLANLNPSQNFKNIFFDENGSPKKIFFSIIRPLFSIILISLISYLFFIEKVALIFDVRFLSQDNSSFEVINLLQDLFSRLFLYILPLVCFNYFLTRHSYFKKQKMTEQEMRQELKETEGNPEIKNSRKLLHREVLSQEMIRKVKKAKLLIVNKQGF